VSLPPERWNDEKWVARHPGEKDDRFPARESVEYKLELATSAVVKVEQLRKEDDALAADDSAQVIVPPPRNLRVLLVSDGENPFLVRAVQSLPVEKPVILLPPQYEAAFKDEKTNPTQYDVIVFDRYVPNQMPAAGNFLCFDAVPRGLQLRPAMEKEHTIEMKDTGVLDWDRDHPILRGLALRKGLGYIEQSQKLVVPLEAQVLVDGLKGPLLVLHHEGRSTYLVTSFDPMESRWPLEKSFPIFMNKTMEFLALGSEMGVRQSYDPGTAVRIPRPSLQKMGEVKEVLMNGPVSRKVLVPATGDFVLPSMDQVGVYKLDPPVPQYEQLAVNLLDANESNLVPAEVSPGSIGTVVDAGAGKSRLELWWWIVACVALPLLYIEWWVYTRRVHL
jgi:hypothetical protein